MLWPTEPLPDMATPHSTHPRAAPPLHDTVPHCHYVSTQCRTWLSLAFAFRSSAVAMPLHLKDVPSNTSHCDAIALLNGAITSQNRTTPGTTLLCAAATSQNISLICTTMPMPHSASHNKAYAFVSSITSYRKRPLPPFLHWPVP